MGEGRRTIVGVVLAGGKSSRMGTEKSLLPLGGVPLVERATARLRPQVDEVILSANGNPDRFRSCAAPVVPDRVPDGGPLVGLLDGLKWARAAGATFVLTVACDTPFFPTDLASRLLQSIANDPLGTAVARSEGHHHYTFALHATAHADELEEWLGRSERRSLRGWLERQRAESVDFEGTPDPFFNINTPMDLALAETWAGALDEQGRTGIG